MKVLKRNGTRQAVSFDKIHRRITYLCGYDNDEFEQLNEAIDPAEIAVNVIKSMDNNVNNITTSQLDEEAVSIAQTRSFIHPDFGILASRIAVSNFHKNTVTAISEHFNIHKKTAEKHLFKYTTELLRNNINYIPKMVMENDADDDAVKKSNTLDKENSTLVDAPLVSQVHFNYAMANYEWIESILNYKRDYEYTFFGFRMLFDKYLLKPVVNTHNGTERLAMERPQHLLMRVAIGVTVSPPYDEINYFLENTTDYTFTDEQKEEIVIQYETLSQRLMTFGTPTLFNIGTPHPQCSSCFLVALPDDSLVGIMKFYEQCAYISKHAGGLGGHIHNLRSRGAYIKGTGGQSNGLVPMLRVSDALSCFVDQGGGKRPGSLAVYLETWHYDVEDFLKLKRKEGNEMQRARSLFYALWISDLFMEKVRDNEDWYLMCPNTCPGLSDVYGKEFNELYMKYVNEKRYRKVIKAQDLFRMIINSMIETGLPYALAKDASNEKSNYKHYGTIKSSNLCVAPDTKILTSNGYFPIVSLHKKRVTVWNGEKFSPVKITKTGENQKMIKVTISDGSHLVCTEYHKFIDESNTKLPAGDLKVGQTIIGFNLPVIENGLDNMENSYRKGSVIDTVPINYNKSIKLQWLAGYIDCQSSYTKDDNGPILLCRATKPESISDIKYMIQTLGIHSKIVSYKPLAYMAPIKSLIIDSNGINQIVDLGVPLKTMKLSKLKSTALPIALKVVSIEPVPDLSDTYCFNEPEKNQGIFNGILTGNCAEIIEYSDKDEIAVCNLASICLSEFVTNGVVDYENLRHVVGITTRALNRIIDLNYYPVKEAKNSNMIHRPIGIGVQGLADLFAQINAGFESDEARLVNFRVFENIYYAAIDESCQLAEKLGPYKSFEGSPISKGKFQFDLWIDEGRELPFELSLDWDGLRERVMKHGVRNALVTALMPTASTSIINGNSACFEPYQSVIYNRENGAGEFTIVNEHLIKYLSDRGEWTQKIRNWIVSENGLIYESIQKDYCPDDIKAILEPIAQTYRSAFEIPPSTIIQLAADRGVFIDQSQSLNMSYGQATPKEVSKSLFQAWRRGLKTLVYYTRSRPKRDALKFALGNNMIDCDNCGA